jgi:hypothetical protein
MEAVMMTIISRAAGLVLAVALLAPGANAGPLAPALTTPDHSHVKTVASPLPRDQARRYHAPVRHHRLNARQVVRILYHRGYRDVRVVRRGHRSYTVMARGYRGIVRLVVSRYSGAVVSRHLVRPYHRNRNHRGPGWSFSFGFAH